MYTFGGCQELGEERLGLGDRKLGHPEAEGAAPSAVFGVMCEQK